MLMAIEFYDGLPQVWIPDKNVELKATADKYFMLLTVGHLSHSSFVTLNAVESLNRQHCDITVDIIAVRDVFKMVTDTALY